jgi:hypothetical protein
VKVAFFQGDDLQSIVSWHVLLHCEAEIPNMRSRSTSNEKVGHSKFHVFMCQANGHDMGLDFSAARGLMWNDKGTRETYFRKLWSASFVFSLMTKLSVV